MDYPVIVLAGALHFCKTEVKHQLHISIQYFVYKRYMSNNQLRFPLLCNGMYSILPKIGLVIDI